MSEATEEPSKELKEAAAIGEVILPAAPGEPLKEAATGKEVEVVPADKPGEPPKVQYVKFWERHSPIDVVLSAMLTTIGGQLLWLPRSWFESDRFDWVHLVGVDIRWQGAFALLLAALMMVRRRPWSSVGHSNARDTLTIVGAVYVGAIAATIGAYAALGHSATMVVALIPFAIYAAITRGAPNG